jgi:Domain of unknown function (DUF4384)
MRRINNQRGLPSIVSSMLILLVTLATPHVHAQSPGSPGLFSIRLEQRKGNSVHAVPQNTVFRNGDILRFRLASQIDGYLYVVDKGTTGSTGVLFPGTRAANNINRIEMNHSYPVPADGDGWFEVSGPSGFDTLYFLVSASPIDLPAGPPAENPASHPQPPPPDLLPRCDDAIFKARGECLDGSAGVAALPPGAAVPRELVPLARTASRDIVLTNDGDDTAIQSAPTAKLPLIYTFRLAHRE